MTDGIDLASMAKPMAKKAPAPRRETPKTSKKEPKAKAKPRPESKTAGETWAEVNKRGNVYLPPDLRAAASIHAEGLGLSFSAYVRQLIEADLGHTAD